MSLVDKIPAPEELQSHRYFEIRDCDSHGNGRFMTFIVTDDTKDEDIFEIGTKYYTDQMLRDEELYIPSPFRQPPEWRRSLKIVEKKVSTYDYELGSSMIERTGRNYGYDWIVKRGGLKFTIERTFTRIKTNRGTYESNAYRFGRVLSPVKSKAA